MHAAAGRRQSGSRSLCGYGPSAKGTAGGASASIAMAYQEPVHSGCCQPGAGACPVQTPGPVLHHFGDPLYCDNNAVPCNYPNLLEHEVPVQ